MSKLITFLSFAFCTYSFAGNAASVTVENTPEAMANVARVSQLFNLEATAMTSAEVKVLVEDLGGSTDVSPSKKVYISFYSKGEMFDVVATFDIGVYFEVRSVSLDAPGIFKVEVVDWNEDQSGFVMKMLTVFAIQAFEDFAEATCIDPDEIIEGRCSPKTSVTVMDKEPVGKLAN